MSLEGLLAEFEQLRQRESGRTLQGQEAPPLGDVDVPAPPPAPQLQCSGLDLAMVGLSQSSPDRPLRGLAVQVEAARLSHDDELARRSAKLEVVQVRPLCARVLARSLGGRTVTLHRWLGVQGELEEYGRARLKLRRDVSSLVVEVARHQSRLAAMAAECGQLQEGGRL